MRSYLVFDEAELGFPASWAAAAASLVVAAVAMVVTVAMAAEEATMCCNCLDRTNYLFQLLRRSELLAGSMAERAKHPTSYSTLHRQLQKNSRPSLQYNHASRLGRSL